MYADDLVLFCPSAKGLQKLLDVCSDFGVNNDVLFNSTKSQVMLFDTRKYGTDTDIVLNGNTLLYVEKYKYLGHIIDNKLNDEADMKSKIGQLYGRSNMLIRKFYFCSTDVKNRLFSAYCDNLYLSYLWVNSRKSVFHSVKVAYNNAYRILHNLDRRCSASGMFVNNHVVSFPEMLRKAMFSFMKRIGCSRNCLISTILASDVYLTSSLSYHWHSCVYVGGCREIVPLVNAQSSDSSPPNL